LRSGCGGDHLLGNRRGFDRSERVVAELAQDVVRTSAQLAGDRQAGAVVVDPPRDLPVVVITTTGLQSSRADPAREWLVRT
jgi:hypothetical protein